ncbi:MAG: nuclear transport factor 2 family protein [Verrucomicrobiota bacterium]
MNPLTLAVALALAFSSSIYADGRMAKTPEQLLEAYENALATQEWDQVAPLIHPNCIVTFSDGSQHRGKEQVGKAFRRNFDLIEDEHYAINHKQWITRSDSFAVVAYTFEWSGTINGNATSGAGVGTSSLVFENDRWLIIAEHLGPKAK